jgi:hypothetical protein
MGMPDAGDDFGAVGLDFHAAAAAKALLAPPQFAVHGVYGNGDPCRQTGQSGYQALAVGFAGGLKSQH